MDLLILGFKMTMNTLYWLTLDPNIVSEVMEL